ncbi:Alpha/beta hydrolase family protein [Pseudarthrobacter enclensis]|uniref:alpha/beta hydrolase n=1 Tax=Pseudarthrobacter enclensis TaxID=993070 RepID=UPI000815FC61|nr:alpha/beta hydrolase [Pseudarthrobacter enclensis]SCC30065.1 Alpha/beta hydrolase family protein [Pseudarthrobacter enclensis]
MATALLVHGAWHNSSAWEAVQNDLNRRGVPSAVLDLPGHGSTPGPETLEADCIAVAEAVRAIDGPVVLVGHSYGGLAISGAQAPAGSVRAYLYVAAFTGPDSVMESYAEGEESPLTGSLIREEDGRFSVPQALGLEVFYHDCSPAAAAVAAEQLEPQAARTLYGRLEAGIPEGSTSVYLVCTQDRVLPPSAQRRMAAGATTTLEISSGHSPMVSRSGDVASLIHDLCSGSDHSSIRSQYARAQ